jgi:hypothetical protein
MLFLGTPEFFTAPLRVYTQEHKHTRKMGLTYRGE